MTSKPSSLRNLQIWLVLLSLTTPALTQTSPECAIEGIEAVHWAIGFPIAILDTAVGDTFSGATQNTVITSIDQVLVSNAGPYASFRMENGKFVAFLLDAFADFEEYQYTDVLISIVIFSCDTVPLLVIHHIQDTNNHSPVLQSETTIIVDTPILGGDLVPDEIIVRDVDLTTSSITFEISTNDYFDIQYIGRDFANRKNFHASLVAKRLIIGLSEPLFLTITATDNDETGDPPKRIEFTLTILANPLCSSILPPLFSQTYYTGIYTAATGLVLADTIEVIEGYGVNVIVTLSGDDSSHFTLNNNNGVISLKTDTQNPISVPVPNNALIFTIVATRQDEPSIRGATAVFIFVPDDPRTGM